VLSLRYPAVAMAHRRNRDLCFCGAYRDSSQGEYCQGGAACPKHAEGNGSWHVALESMEDQSTRDLHAKYPNLDINELRRHVETQGARHDARRADRRADRQGGRGSSSAQDPRGQARGRQPRDSSRQGLSNPAVANQQGATTYPRPAPPRTNDRRRGRGTSRSSSRGSVGLEAEPIATGLANPQFREQGGRMEGLFGRDHEAQQGGGGGQPPAPGPFPWSPPRPALARSGRPPSPFNMPPPQSP